MCSCAHLHDETKSVYVKVHRTWNKCNKLRILTEVMWDDGSTKEVQERDYKKEMLLKISEAVLLLCITVKQSVSRWIFKRIQLVCICAIIFYSQWGTSILCQMLRSGKTSSQHKTDKAFLILNPFCSICYWNNKIYSGSVCMMPCTI